MRELNPQKKRRGDRSGSTVLHLVSGLNFSDETFVKSQAKKTGKNTELNLKILKVQESIALWSLEQKRPQVGKGVSFKSQLSQH